MTEILLGAVGALLAVGLLAAGAAIGWKTREWLRGKPARATEREQAERERKALQEEQRAFRQMLNYNAETAYGMVGEEAEL